MDQNVYSERQKREKEFFDRLSNMQTTQEISFDPILGREKRPWNPFWVVYDLVLRNFKGRGQRLLDFGCGTGVASIRFAKIGYEVYGFDISENNIKLAKHLSSKYGLDEHIHFSVQVAEKLDYPNDFFDIVIGMDILHHVEIKPTINECFRVLRSDGRVFFIEPIQASFLDAMRNTKLVKYFINAGTHYKKHITHDEKKLNPLDLEIIKERFPKMSYQRYTLLSRFDRFFRKPESPKPSFLEKIDYFLFKVIPPLSFLGGVIVINLKKE